VVKYPFCSLADYFGKRDSPIISKDILTEIFTPESFKEFSREVILGGKWTDGAMLE
jgi:hypothetical protein